MIQNNLGKLIAQSRLKKGITQRELANMLFVTDKAVSKWERGLSTPDNTLFVKISNILDIDLEYLLPNSNHDNDWKGHIIINEDNNIYKRCLVNQTVFEYLIGYYLLVGIKEIYVTCKDESFIKNLNLEQYGVTIFLNQPIEHKKLFTITDNLFLFGANLTRLLMTCLTSDFNIDFYFENNKMPISLRGFNDLKNKKIGRGYICNVINDSNFKDIEDFIVFFNKYNSFKIGYLKDIVKNRSL